MKRVFVLIKCWNTRDGEFHNIEGVFSSRALAEKALSSENYFYEQASLNAEFSISEYSLDELA